MAPLHSGNHATVKWHKGPKDVSAGKVLPTQMQGLEFLSSEPMQSKIWQGPSSDAGIGDPQQPKARQPAPQSMDKKPWLQHTHAQTHNYASSCTHIHTRMYPYAYTHMWN